MLVKSRAHWASTVCGVSLLVAGCAGPVKPYTAPALDLPAETSSDSIPVLQSDWWRAFNDPVLNAWVDEALARNWDVVKAATQVAEAQAGLRSAQALNSPRLDAVTEAGVRQRRIGTSTPAQEFNQQVRAASIGAALSWEWDLWGRVAQLNTAAQARAESAERVRQATALSVAAWVCQTYFQWRTLQDKWLIAQSALKQLDRVSELERRRWQAGLGTELAYRQSLAEAASVRAQITPLEAGIAKTGLALQALAGRSPRELTPELPNVPATQVALPSLPEVVDTRVLLRRPDVAAAEWTVQAEHANWNVSQAQRYPRVSLNLVGGLLASSSALISGLPLSFEATTGLGVPLFDGGSLEAQVQASQARRERAIVQYRQTVQQAYREMHDAVLQIESSDRHAGALIEELGLRQQALSLAQKSYKAGRSSQYEVLSETVKVLQVQWSMSDTRQSQWVARSQFYKAMGGGL